MVAEDQRALIERPAARPGAPAADPGFLGLVDEALVRLRLEDYLMLAVERVRDRVSADAAYLLMLRDLEDEYEVRAVSGLSATLIGKRLASGAAGAPDHRTPHLPVMVADLSKKDVPLLSGSGLCSLVLVPIAAENRVVGAIGVASAHVNGFSTDESVLLQQIANGLAVATDRARLQALERERRGWLTFLAEAGDFLAGSLDQDMTMAITGQIVVPKIAQWCAVHLDDDRGNPVLEQVWHEDERLIEPLRADLEANAAEARDETEDPGRPGKWGEVLTVPLIARGRRIGHLALGRPVGDPLRGEPLLVAESVARRAAIAIENARAHGELRAIGNALQSSLLPSSIPEAQGLDVGVVYEAAGQETTAGGDFYDLFPIGGGKSCFVVGDVCGTGPQAAAVTGLARHTIRALVLAGFPISDVLERLNTAIIDEGERSRFLTLVCGVLQPDGDAMRVEMVSAGHPLPMIVRQSGQVEQVGRPQSLLGVVDDVRYFEEQHRLSRGEMFVAVTDGVLERRVGQLMIGEEGLEKELAQRYVALRPGGRGTSTPARRGVRPGGSPGRHGRARPPGRRAAEGRLTPSARSSGEGECEVPFVVGEAPLDLEAGRAKLGGDALDPELRRDLDPDLLAAREVDRDAGARDRHVLGHLGPQPQVHPLHPRVPERDVGERVEVEVGVEAVVEHLQAVRDEPGGDPARVVVGRDQAVGALDQVRAEQQPVAGVHGVGERAEEGCALLDVEVPDRSTQEGDHAPTALGKVPEVQREVTDQGLDLQARVPLGELQRRGPEGLLGHVDRDEAGEPPGRREGSRRMRVFSLVPLPSSTSVVAPVVATISSACSVRMERSRSVG